MQTERKLFNKPIIEFNGKTNIELGYTEDLPITFKIELLEDLTEPLHFKFILTNGEVDKIVGDFEMPTGKRKQKFTKEIKFDFASTVYEALINWALLIDVTYQGQNVCRGNVMVSAWDKSGKYDIQTEDSDFFDLQELEEMEEIEENEEGEEFDEEEEENEEELQKAVDEMKNTKLTPEIAKTFVKNVAVMQISEGVFKAKQEQLDE